MNYFIVFWYELLSHPFDCEYVIQSGFNLDLAHSAQSISTETDHIDILDLYLFF